MKKNYLFIFLLFSCNSFSQTKGEFVKAFNKPDAYIGLDFITNCMLSIEKVLKHSEALDLYGYELHNDGCFAEYYKAIYEKRPYLIKSDDVILTSEQSEYLRTIDTTEQKILLDKVLVIAKSENERLTAAIESKSKAYLSKGKQNGILIGKSNVYDESEYTSGTGYEVKVLNMSKKTIKYLWFTVKALNAVNDPISTKTLKGIGPLDPNSEGSYTFDYTWMTDIVDSCKLISLKIQYMDGSIKTIPNAQNLKVPEGLYDYMFNNSEE